ncbi:MAG: HPF/RaiA family ribosome-associated protein [Rhodospirillaceae bacterium]|nr:HPF/RaiA family ribosome-associated protein [Rhodospirillaceae bacterium]
MQHQAQISFHGIDHSDAVETHIRERVSKLDKIFDRITRCRVVAEAHHNSHAHANAAHRPFHVSIRLDVPGDELVVKSDKKNPRGHEDLNAAVREAFATMERQLKEYVRRKWYDKRRETVPEPEIET